MNGLNGRRSFYVAPKEVPFGGTRRKLQNALVGRYRANTVAKLVLLDLCAPEQ